LSWFAAGLLNIKLDNGEYLIKDKQVTGFSNEEEQLAQLDQYVPFLTEDELIKRGAHYKKADKAYDPYAIEDGRHRAEPSIGGPSCRSCVSTIAERLNRGN
jgi:putative intracellular protease/amidase